MTREILLSKAILKTAFGYLHHTVQDKLGSSRNKEFIYDNTGILTLPMIVSRQSQVTTFRERTSIF